MRDAAARWGTPLYVTDLDAAAAALAAYQAALPGALIAYAVKASPDPRLLRRLVAEGAGCEVVTATELALARSSPSVKSAPMAPRWHRSTTVGLDPLRRYSTTGS